MAACGVLADGFGRGLGHTGGTLDKLESIPVFRIQLGPEASNPARALGIVMVGHGPIGAGDGRLYALRERTSPRCERSRLSIASKNLAEGGSDVYDVNAATGFMKTEESALRSRAGCARRPELVARSQHCHDMSPHWVARPASALSARTIDVLQGRVPRMCLSSARARALMLSRSERADPWLRGRVDERWLGSAWRSPGSGRRAMCDRIVWRAEGVTGAPVVRPHRAREGFVSAVATVGLAI